MPESSRPLDRHQAPSACENAAFKSDLRERIAISGLRYVGLQVAPGFAAKFPGTIRFDIDADRVQALRRGEDWTSETSPDELTAAHLPLTHNPQDLKGAEVFVDCVLTPFDEHKRPDLAPLRSASVFVCESTLYSGLTEEFCAPHLERESGLWCGADFSLDIRRNGSTLAARHTVLHG
jgi:UDP-N-acetyl-D-galactosamine dehydrogenase